jgi:hypothetical protein
MWLSGIKSNVLVKILPRSLLIALFMEELHNKHVSLMLMFNRTCIQHLTEHSFFPLLEGFQHCNLHTQVIVNFLFIFYHLT